MPTTRLHDPAVWQDIYCVYGRCLELYPWNTQVRSQFVKWACICGQWQEANHQLQILGDQPDLKEFGGRGMYNYYRKKAAEHAAPATQPAEPAK